MKTVLYICLLFFVGALVYNLTAMDFRMSLTKEQNQPYLIGAIASILGFLLTLVILRFKQLKEKVKSID